MEGVEWIPTMISMYSGDMPESTTQICPSQFSTLRFWRLDIQACSSVYSGSRDLEVEGLEVWLLRTRQTSKGAVKAQGL